MKLSLFRKRGMTLVEIMIVVVVLGVIPGHPLPHLLLVAAAVSPINAV